MHHSIWKILFVLGGYEYLERQEGKIRKCLFFYVKIFWNNSVLGLVAIRYIWFLLVFLLKTLLVKRHLHKRGRWEHFPTFFSLDPFLTFCSKSSKNAYKFKWEAFRPKSWSHFSCNFFGGILAKKKWGFWYLKCPTIQSTNQLLQLCSGECVMKLEKFQNNQDICYGIPHLQSLRARSWEYLQYKISQNVFISLFSTYKE